MFVVYQQELNVDNHYVLMNYDTFFPRLKQFKLTLNEKAIPCCVKKQT